ncbi:hypothetical protein NW754_016279 [Fusarium falciforme]|nr:hypothetical protein NW754_016279 [Fusarium falciforme]
MRLRSEGPVTPVAGPSGTQQLVTLEHLSEEKRKRKRKKTYRSSFPRKGTLRPTPWVHAQAPPLPDTPRLVAPAQSGPPPPWKWSSPGRHDRPMPWSKTNLKAYLPEEEHHKVDGSLHGPIIDAAVQRGAAISHDTTDTLGRMVHARLERIHGRIDSLAGQSRAIEQKAQDELHEAVNSVRNEVLSTLVDLGKELRQEYTAKFSDNGERAPEGLPVPA